MKKIIIPIIFILWLGIHITNSLICRPEKLTKKKETLKKIIIDLKETRVRLNKWKEKTQLAPEIIKPIFIAQVKALSITKKTLKRIKKELENEIKIIEKSRK